MIVLYVKNPKMTLAEIKQLVANLNYNRVDEEKKTEEQNARLDEEVKDIEAAYNPRQYYDFAYFKSKTKEQLLNIVMDLQRTYVENPKNFWKFFKKSRAENLLIYSQNTAFANRKG